MLYFCHHCHTQIAADELLPEFTCPSCHSGFVEEMAQSRQNSTVDESSRDTDPMSRRLSSDELSDDNSDVEFLDAYNSSYAQVFDLFQPHQSQMQRQSATTDNESNSAAQSSQSDQGTQNNRINPRPPVRAPRSQFGNRPTVTYSTNNQSLADVLTDFISGVSFGSQFPEGAASNAQPGLPGGSGPMGANRGLINIDFPLPFFLHSNPGDYAWGNAGFDAVITQLLNNLDGSNSGPPPMSEEQLDNLPTITIKDDQVKKTNLQCTVCMDDFQTGDQARQLPCEHFFHEDCIKPWLNIVSILWIVTTFHQIASTHN